MVDKKIPDLWAWDFFDPGNLWKSMASRQAPVIPVTTRWEVETGGSLEAPEPEGRAYTANSRSMGGLVSPSPPHTCRVRRLLKPHTLKGGCQGSLNMGCVWSSTGGEHSPCIIHWIRNGAHWHGTHLTLACTNPLFIFIVVLASFISTWDKLESFWKKEPQLRKYLH